MNEEQRRSAIEAHRQLAEAQREIAESFQAIYAAITKLVKQ